MSGTLFRAGECPKCGSRALAYGVIEPFDEGMSYPYHCNGCGCDGYEDYSLEFIGYTDRDGNEVHRAENGKI